jgi:hypothetical protein
MPVGTLTAILHREGDVYVADCPEVGTVSQGKVSNRLSPILRKRLNSIWRNFRLSDAQGKTVSGA